MGWIPLRNVTHYSLLKGFSKPDDIAKKCKEQGYQSCGIADYRTVSGCIEFFKACKKNGIKPILGCDFGDFTLFAKNLKGWHNLMKLSSEDISTISISEYPDLIMVDNNGKHKDILPLSYYVNKEDAKLHRVLICSEFQTTLPKVTKEIRNGESKEYHKYFITDKFCILDNDESTELCGKHKDQVSYIEQIDSLCEEYNILNKPMLPRFDCPNNQTEEEYLTELNRQGWRNLLIKSGKVSTEEAKKAYGDRFKEEFGIISGANLCGYFLIVRDIIKYAEGNGWLCGPGRGSAAGCLISYLIGITKVDPVEFDLLFSRFYNAGRNTADNISLPDIDVDVPTERRDQIIAYLKDKYGHDRVSQMITFGRLQGKSAIKEVLRVNESCSFAEMNAISKAIPDESKISDQLAEMDDEDRSIIKWALIHNAKELQDYCRLTDDDKLEGEYAEAFEQAIKIEGTFKTQGKHASGVVISSKPLKEVCPIGKQKDSDENIVKLEMSDLDSIGLPKFDILGLSLLDKIMFIQELVKEQPEVFNG